jgi:hypothetical protein
MQKHQYICQELFDSTRELKRKLDFYTHLLAKCFESYDAMQTLENEKKRLEAERASSFDILDQQELTDCIGYIEEIKQLLIDNSVETE